MVENIVHTGFDREQTETRTTRMPAFWGYTPPPHDYSYCWPVDFESHVHTTDQFILDPSQNRVKAEKLEKLAKNYNIAILL